MEKKRRRINDMPRPRGAHGQTWYKVTTRTGRPIYGRPMTYYLARGRRANRRWHKHVGYLHMCAAGFHATQTPWHWVRCRGAARLFQVEVRGPSSRDDAGASRLPCGTKWVFRYLRFVREIRSGTKEWRYLMRQR